MHRTTISLESSIERDLKRLAAHQRKSLSELANYLLRKGLEVYRSHKKQPATFVWHTSKGHPHPAFDPADRSTYLETISRKIG